MLCRFIGKIERLVKHLGNALCRGHGAGRKHKEHCDHQKGHENLCDIGDEGREISHRHTAVHNKLASKPYGGDYGGIHTKAHNGLKEYHNLHSSHTGLFKVAVCGGKFLLLKILPHEGFYHPDICDVFLNGGVKTVYLGLHFCKTGESHFCYDKYCRKKNRHTHKEYHRKPRLKGYGHNKSADHHSGGAQSHSQHHIDKVLQLGNVVCKSCDKRSGGKPIDVGKGKGLHLFINVVANVGRKIDRSLGAEIGSSHSAKHHCKGGEHHSDHVSEA